VNKLYIGTSGYNYKHWREVFYPKGLSQKNWLSFYAKYFDTVEINATFYGNFKKNVFENWAGEVPDNFQFCLKGPRFITHVKRLKTVEDSISIFFENAIGLGEKLNIILWQFPKSFKMNEENLARLESFLSILPNSIKCHQILKHPKSASYDVAAQVQSDNRIIRHAFEFREGSWFTKQIYQLLNKYKAGFVIPDSPQFQFSTLNLASHLTSGKLEFYYIRFHGSSELYSSEYTKEELKNWSLKIKKMLKKGDVYCYFNNDAQGFAVKNAMELKEILGLA